jgi:hypothetical protein
MALICTGTFRGIPIQNAYVKVINITFDSQSEFYVATFASYMSKEEATNFPTERAIDRFSFEFPANRAYTDVYNEVYTILKNGTYILDRTKYDAEGNMRYANTQYFPQITSMVDE